MFYFYVFGAQHILQKTPCERKRSIMHLIKNAYLRLCLSEGFMGKVKARAHDAEPHVTR